MSDDLPRVPTLVHARTTPPGRNGGGGGDDSRLRVLEEGMARLDERVDAIKEHMAEKGDIASLKSQVDAIKQHMAEKNDITSLKVWILGGVLGAIPIATVIAAAVVRVFF